MDILQEIAGKTKERIIELKKEIPLSTVKKAAFHAAASPPSFYHALRTGSIAFICEVKRASPPKESSAGIFLI